MPSQSESSSPFQNNIPQVASTSEDFSIRTMKDDLERIQKNELLSSEKIAAASEEAPASIPNLDDAPLQKSNPFFEQEAAPAPKPAAPEKTISKTELVEAAPTEKVSDGPTTTAYKIVLAVIFLLIIAIVILGGYYFWMTRTPKQAPPIENPTSTAPIIEAIPVVTPGEKYSPTTPNYIMLDLTTMSDTEISETIKTVVSDLKNPSSQVPYEFIIVDNNNNPIAFPIFATAAKFNLAPTLLSTLDQAFSLYIYNDNNTPHLAVAVSIQNQGSLSAELTKQEQTFTQDAAFLFLGATPEITTGQFATGSYLNLSTRYLNLNKDETLSIDYAINNSKLIIGTSKNTLRAIIDKVNQVQVLPVTEPTELTLPAEPEQQIESILPISSDQELYSRIKADLASAQNMGDFKKVINQYGSAATIAKINSDNSPQSLTVEVSLSEPETINNVLGTTATIKTPIITLTGQVTMIQENGEWKANLVSLQ